MQKSLDIFTAKPQSVFEVICERKSTGFYMPAYQRPYSWEEKHIQDLFSDCASVFKNLLDSSDAIIFLGSILCVDDSAASTVYPLQKRHIPSDIKLIIDGQQRLSTLILIIMCLNEQFRILLPVLKKAIDKEEDNYSIDALEELREIVSQLILDTSNFSIETQADHAVYKYLPKIIRSQVDCWGKDDKKASYQSPLSELLISYQRHVINQHSDLSFKEFDLTSLSLSSKRVINNVKEIRKQLKCIQNGFQFMSSDGEVEEKLSVSDFVDIETLDICLDFPVDNKLLKASSNNNKIEQIIFLTAFAKFLLHRVCLTYVEVNNESYAFDMFEALNTTGEPLTAIETFVPKVIEHIGSKRRDGISEIELEESISTLTSITERFESIITSERKNAQVKALILCFVRAYQGKVKITNLRDQRDAMLKSYEGCNPKDNKDYYLNYLGKTAAFIFDHWQARAPNTQGLVAIEDLDVANVCLRYLVDMKHEIVQSLLVQFILQDAKYELTGTAEASFGQILKAVTAFSVLWRAMSGGADGIDNVYKKLHEKGFDVAGVFYKAYQLKDSSLSTEEFSVDAIKAFFRQALESKIEDKGSPKDGTYDKWLDICSKQPLLTKSKSIKFLILAGFHGMALQDNCFVRTVDAKSNFISPIMWDLISSNDRIKKVYNGGEGLHSDWNDAEIANLDEFNKLGNVLIDARNSISLTTQKSWYSLKQHMLEALGNDSINSLDSILSCESEVSIEAQKNAAVLMLETKYAEITYADEWNKQVINERTELLLKNAWTNLKSWLE
ncbi:DUF262 domain-containing protein [Shewanella sp. ALD9]|uniref:DUF262 domain-containing protein n=1 Tax=Shewanella sp. ALD9 TaxID=2058330 RepID=UPI000C3470F6|nr:DUF262 domain-containing protein [Shewanella sp. ALD9]PKH32650.1 hypothetical protein CXF88_12530 [Shewanella sp. ALD9]